MAVEGGAEAVQEADGAEPRAKGWSGSGFRHETDRVTEEPAMRRPMQGWQTPRPLQEKGTRNPWPQPVQRARAKPWRFIAASKTRP